MKRLTHKKYKQTLDKFYLFCSQYLFNAINKKIISFHEKEYQKLINKSNDFSTEILNKQQNYQIIQKFLTMKTNQLILKKIFVKHLRNIFLLFIVETLNFLNQSF
jgi:hypothetical protein